MSDPKLVKFPDGKYGVLVQEEWLGRVAKFASLKDYTKTFHQNTKGSFDTHCKGTQEQARDCLAKIKAGDSLGYEVVE